MSRSINEVRLIGRLGRSPELSRTNGGAPVTNFSLATSEVFNDSQGQRQESTEWHNIVVWGKAAETCCQYLEKGALVHISGKNKTRNWDNNGVTCYRTEIHTHSVMFLESKKDKPIPGGSFSSGCEQPTPPTAEEPPGYLQNPEQGQFLPDNSDGFYSTDPDYRN